MLDVAVVKRLGAFRLDVAFSVDAGTTLVVVGESGSGKSTLLRLLAGLEVPDNGSIALDDVVYADAARDLMMPPWQRAIGFVPQDYALFPHLTVFENVAFGLRAMRTDRAEIESRVAESLEQLGIAKLAGARPRELSGGQQQRVALSRALVLRPQLLLLDEPMSALDLATRRSIRTALRAILESLACATVYATHAPSEALILGDRIAALEDGRITQIGSRDEFVRRPRSPYVAAFLGVNLLSGTMVERAPAPGGDGEWRRVATTWGDLWCAAPAPGNGDAVTLTISPDVITLHRERPADRRGINVVQGELLEIVPAHGGRQTLMTLDGEPVLSAVLNSDLTTFGIPRIGETLWATFDASAVTLTFDD
ncbi:MAG TPA: ABC transporter ATP-binding protein [Gemmatimonadales bacterium]|jgi:ABC-type Fe3+/spermidine/putrescine transport system ATPase subunit